MKYTFKPTKVCCKEINFNIENNAITDIEFIGGCPGNLIGISNLVKGADVYDIVALFKDIPCGKKETSCPAQLAMALEEILYKK